MSDDETTPQRLREATADEDRLVKYLSRIVGQVTVQAWNQLPPEMKDGFHMAIVFSTALAHNLGQLLAAMPKEHLAVDDPAWLQMIETTLEMVRANAVDARRRVLEQQAILEAGGTKPDAEEATAQTPRVVMPQPKFLM